MNNQQRNNTYSSGIVTMLEYDNYTIIQILFKYKHLIYVP